MNTNDQTKMPTVMQQALQRAGIAAALIAIGISAASAQMAPIQPAPAPAAPTAPVAQAAGQYDATFKRVDANGDGAFSKVELEKADAKLSADFAKYDSNRHGRLSTAEFDAMMKAMKG